MIETNIKARKDACAAIDLIGDQPQRFWEVMKEHCESKLPKKPIEEDNRNSPLNEQHAIRFEAVSMPYGKHKGEEVGQVPCSYLEFLAEGDDFMKALRRYVKSQRYKERRQQES